MQTQELQSVAVKLLKKDFSAKVAAYILAGEDLTNAVVRTTQLALNRMTVCLAEQGASVHVVSLENWAEDNYTVVAQFTTGAETLIPAPYSYYHGLD